jgi:hypothetical protein
MSRWLVTDGDHQFSVADLNELKQLAAGGKVGPGAMVQPPGATDWLYANEVPELQSLFPGETTNSLHDDFDIQPRPNRGLLYAVLCIVALAGAYGMFYFGTRLPTSDDLQVIGGSKGMELTEMHVIRASSIRGKPDAAASTVGSVDKDSRVHLVAKRGTWYNIKSTTGVAGWLPVDSVIPAYYFADSATRESYDPLYNPDRYVFVKNSSWMQLPDQRANNITIFQFMLQNKSKFPMSHIKLLATIKDKNDGVLETKEIEIEGRIPPYDGVMVGTLAPPEDQPDGVARLMTTKMYDRLRKKKPKLAMRWSDGVEVQMDSDGFVEANIDLLEVRANTKGL